ncbi:hypothetical protein I4I73_13365 [Pseudonocardia sp. KRD-184]|uniref:Uncharacterized protein n=1 Tax=Pseudonocardia oceani TaxID=2792013 RepID=A0ABS6UHG7_9PSEU|nr:hypothetical protein [Pseudonocardia oceani]MBW0089892.1 hypothetical protein [Pseudonocardia oceani]MBW0096977.1 hypothetical protein [Pseudonocardia oceani]MBW0109652.1 hypothetical protein [Pseudonocardia oceani]MBW0122492.1 hypothetical protein [Pseudonocardia oceani]MBW0131688.1 hypothetical protein [Pseudonocardia oceani]
MTDVRARRRGGRDGPPWDSCTSRAGAPPGRTRSSAYDDPAVAAAVARLGAESAGRVRMRRILRTVVPARHDLARSPGPALPELVERLARERVRAATG